MKPYCLWWVDRPIFDEQVAWQVTQMVQQGIERIALGGVEDEEEHDRLSKGLNARGIELVPWEAEVTFYEPWARVQTLEAAKYAYIGASVANIPQQPIALLRAFLDRENIDAPGLFYQSPQWPFFHALLDTFLSNHAPVHSIPFSTGQVVYLEEEDWHFTANGGNRVSMVWGEGESWEAQFVLEEAVSGLRVLVQSLAPDVYLYLDDTLLEPMDGWEVDMGIRVFAIPAVLPLGKHRLRIARNSGPVWLAGDFRADWHSDGVHIQPVRGVTEGAWERQGFGDFSGCGTYINTVNIPEFEPGQRIELIVLLCGGILEVEVNGVLAGQSLWGPYRVDITENVQSGQAVVLALRCTNSLVNLLGADSGAPSGLVQGVCFRVCTQKD